MIIVYRNWKLETLLNTKRELVKTFGKKVARALMMRMDLLRNVDYLAQVPHGPPEKCHELKGNRKGQFAVYTGADSGVRLIFKPDHDPLPRKEDGGIDLRQVTAVWIWEVKNYHDE